MNSMLESNPSVGVHMVTLSAPSLEEEKRELLKELWQARNLFSDFAIHVRGKEFRAHKMVLTAHSSYFKKMADIGFKTRESVDADPEMVEYALMFLYNSQLEIPEDEVGMLEEVAQMLGIHSLQKQCRYSILLESELTKENCAEVRTSC